MDETEIDTEEFSNERFWQQPAIISKGNIQYYEKIVAADATVLKCEIWVNPDLTGTLLVSSLQPDTIRWEQIFRQRIEECEIGKYKIYELAETERRDIFRVDADTALNKMFAIIQIARKVFQRHE